jgi:hypothetical protein
MFAKTKEDLGILKCIDNEQNQQRWVHKIERKNKLDV